MSQRERDLYASLRVALRRYEEARRNVRFWAVMWFITWIGLVVALVL